MPAPNVTIIGVGALGNALAGALSEAGIPIKSIFNRTENKADYLAEKFQTGISGTFPSEEKELGNLIFITVADAAIKNIADQLSNVGKDFSDKIIVHCSGNEPAHLLNALKSKGGEVASFHPLQTFTKQSAASDFENIYFSLQGDKSTFPQLNHIAQRLGAETLEVTKKQKSHLHAAAVMASNYLNTLLTTAVEVTAISDLKPEEAKKALMPLVKTTLQNMENQPFEKALSGPIKRGDVSTVRQHVELLKDQPELLSMYRLLGQRTVQNARRSQHIDEDTANKLLITLGS